MAVALYKEHIGKREASLDPKGVVRKQNIFMLKKAL
jgi:hypothetical protein